MDFVTLSFTKYLSINFRFMVGVVFYVIMDKKKSVATSLMGHFGFCMVVFLVVGILVVGYVFLHLDVHGMIVFPKSGYYIITFIFSHTSSFIDITNVMASVFNFPDHQRMVVALLQAYYQLSLLFSGGYRP